MIRILKRIIKKILLLLKAPKYLLRGNRFSIKTTLEPGAYLNRCKIGKYTYVGMNSYFNHVTIGNYCSIAGYVCAGAMEHSHWKYSTSSYLSDEGYDDHETVMGNDVWIGTHCIIRQGVKIGNGAVIGANSFVNKDVPPFAIVVGSPAKILKYRFSDEIIEELQNSRYWDFPPEKARTILDEIRIRHSM